jgi:hypothetical protein
MALEKFWGQKIISWCRKFFFLWKPLKNHL